MEEKIGGSLEINKNNLLGKETKRQRRTKENSLQNFKPFRQE